MTNSRALRPLTVKIKTADVTIDTDTTITLDADLQTTLEVGTYMVFFDIFFNSHADADIKFQALASTGTMTAAMANQDLNTATPSTVKAIDTDIAVSTAAVVEYLPIRGSVTVSVKGIFGLGWAQNVSNGANTTVKKGSSMMIIKQ